MGADDTTTDTGRELQAANAFDLRRILAGLFLLYGILLTVLGIFDSAAEVEQAAGVRINLWAGLGMIVMALLFLTWALLRPLSRQIEEAEARDAAAQGERPAT
jgi:xanthine/uracil/vitamin C permease (AzgA family)